ncbi:hypothetical protein DACRYDRAFT_51185, partial [Dacryopinax primogenitus]
NLTVGYDIGCDHSKTLSSSSLGQQVQDTKFHMYISMFHGYAHNHKCQLWFHPCFLMTASLETLETNEWVFSKQNLTTHLFCHASTYH